MKWAAIILISSGLLIASNGQVNVGFIVTGNPTESVSPVTFPTTPRRATILTTPTLQNIWSHPMTTTFMSTFSYEEMTPVTIPGMSSMNMMRYFDFEPSRVLEFLRDSLSAEGEMKLNMTLNRLEQFGQAVNLTEAMKVLLGPSMGAMVNKQLTDNPMIMTVVNTMMEELMHQITEGGNIDIMTADWSVVKQKLMNIDWKIVDEKTISAVLAQLEPMLPAALKNLTADAVSGIENGNGIKAHLEYLQHLARMIMENNNMVMMRNMTEMIPQEIIDAWINSTDVQIRNIYTNLSQSMSDWSQKTNLEKLYLLHSRVNQNRVLASVMSAYLRMIDRSFPTAFKEDLRSFLNELENDRSVAAKLKSYIERKSIEKHNEMVDQLLAYNITIFERMTEGNLTFLETFGIVEEIDSRLRSALKAIMADPDMASMYNQESDLGKLAGIMFNFTIGKGFQGVGQRIITESMSMADAMATSILEILASEGRTLLHLNDIKMKLMNAFNLTQEDWGVYADVARDVMRTGIRETYDKLAGNATWTSLSNYTKLMQLVKEFDFEKHAMKMFSQQLLTFVNRLDSQLSPAFKVDLSSFLSALVSNNSVTDRLKTYVEQTMLDMYNGIVSELRAYNITIEPATVANFTFLNSYGIVDEIDKQLRSAVQTILTDPELASMYNSETDLAKLMGIMYYFNANGGFQAVGSRIMMEGMSMADAAATPILQILENGSKLYNQLDNFRIQALNSRNMTDKYGLSIVMRNVTFASLRDSYAYISASANWTNLGASAKLVRFVMMFDYRMYAMRMLSAQIRNLDGKIPMSADISSFMMFVRSSDKPAMVDMFNQKFIQKQMEMCNRTMPMFNPAMAAIAGEISQQFIDQYNKAKSSNMTEMMMNMMNMMPTMNMMPMMNMMNAMPMMNIDPMMTFDNLTDLEQFAHIMYRLNYPTIGEVIFAEAKDMVEMVAAKIMDSLKNGKDISPMLDRAVSMAFDILETRLADYMNNTMGQLFMQLVGRNGVKVAMDALAKEINMMYQNVSSDMNFKNFTNLSKLMTLFAGVDPMVAVNAAAWEAVNQAQAYIPVGIKDAYNSFITNAKNGESVKADLLAFVDMVQSMVPEADFFLLDMVLDPVLDDIAAQITALSRSGSMDTSDQATVAQQLMSIMSGLDMSRTASAVLNGLASGANGFVTATLPTLMQNIPDRYVTPFITMMDNMKNGWKIKDQLPYILAEMMPNNTFVNIMLNNPIATVFLNNLNEALNQSVIDAKARIPDWENLSAREKFRLMATQTDFVTLVMSANSQSMNDLVDYTTFDFTAQCSDDLDMWWTALQRGEYWAIRMIDSWGKPPSGVFNGDTNWIGSQEECLQITANRTSGDVKVEGQFKGEYSQIVVNAPTSLQAYGMQFLAVGLCLPKSCNKDDVMEMVEGVQLFGMEKPMVRQHGDFMSVKGMEGDSLAIATTAVLSFLVLVVLLCTLYDRAALIPRERCHAGKKHTAANAYVVASNGLKNGGFEKDEKHELSDVEKHEKSDGHYVMNSTLPNPVLVEDVPEKPKKPSCCTRFIMALSIYRTLPVLLDSTPRPTQLQALDGIRFLSMTWVILGHTYSIATIAQISATKNMNSANEWANDWRFMGIYGGIYAVDSFFLLSGLLVGYLFLKMMQKLDGKIRCFHITMYYVHRIIRLTPLYAIIILFYAAYESYLGTGPLFPGDQPNSMGTPGACQRHWWTSLLYVNNLVYPKDQCVGWGWYLANDMQFYVIAPLILIPLYLVPALGMVILGLLMAAHIGVTGYFWSTYAEGANQLINPDIFNEMYIRPYTRIGPYLVGIFLAWMLFKKMKLKKPLVSIVWWILSLAVIATVIYTPFFSFGGKGILGNNWSVEERSAYETLARVGWAVALAWVVFACNTGVGGVVADLLNWSGWAPLSRLTYAAYLIHPIIQLVYTWNKLDLYYVSHLNFTFINMGFLVISYGAAAVLYLFFEAPMAGIEKLILPRKR